MIFLVNIFRNNCRLPQNIFSLATIRVNEHLEMLVELIQQPKVQNEHIKTSLKQKIKIFSRNY